MTRLPVRLLLAAALALAACGLQDGSATEAPAEEEVVVFAAASLTDAFEELADAFAAASVDVRVLLNAAGSQTLARQINAGAPADVFASADDVQMDAVADAGNLAGPPKVFAVNGLAIAVEPGNPLGIRTLADLDDPDLVVVLPAEQVPAGAYARTVLASAGVTVTPASLEDDVRAALSKVALGEADAALVYTSDIVGAGDRVEGVAIDPEVNVRARYTVAPLAGAPAPNAARAFIDLVLSDTGRQILARHGFSSP